MDVDHNIEVACIDRCKHSFDAAYILVDKDGDRFPAADPGEGAGDPLRVLHQFRKVTSRCSSVKPILSGVVFLQCVRDILK